jgi:LCP family protein required for cell wall assembly
MLPKLPNKKNQKLKTSRMAKFFFFFFVILLIIAATFTSKIIFSGYSLLENTTGFPKEGSLSTLWSQFRKIFPSQEKLLKGETEDRINFLLLGVGGPGHEGAYLTDTIILTSLKPTTKQVTLLSIPRDLYVPIPDYGWQRINNAYSLAEANSSQGGELISQVVSNILNLPVHYWAVIDFSGFKEVIDKLDGVKVNVERSFADYHYPAPNYKYQTIFLKKVGKKWMEKLL